MIPIGDTIHAASTSFFPFPTFADYQILLQTVRYQTCRVLRPERMDQPDLPVNEHRSALRSLARINWWSRSAAIVGSPIFHAARESSRPLRVLDIASGGGDVLIRLARESERRRLAIEWTGCDISPTAVEFARQNAAAFGLPIHFVCGDALREEIAGDYDVVMCSLFLHHLTEEQAVTLLSRMRALGNRVLVNDLLRSRLGFWLAQIGCRVLSRSAVVHYDGPVSVQGAFTIAEVREFAARAGIPNAVFRRCWPERFLMDWSRRS